MHPYKVLLIEDLPVVHEILLTRIGGNPLFSLEYRTSANSASEAILNKEWDIILIDLQLDPKKQGIIEGIGLGEMARKHLPHAAIIMYSGLIKRGREDKFEHYQRCLDAGANAVITRNVLCSIGVNELQNRMENWIKEQTTKVAIQHRIVFAENRRTFAIVDSFGESELKDLLTGLYPDSKHTEVEALQAGYSGSAILRISTSSTLPASNIAHQVLKISRQEFDLADELARRPVPGTQLGEKAVTPHSVRPFQRHGIFAIASVEVRGAVLLREFLQREPNTPANRRVLDGVVEHLLIAPAREAQPWAKFGVQSGAYSLRPAAINTIGDFLDEAVKWKTVIGQTHFRDLQEAQAFLALVESGAWNFDQTVGLAAELHGDLHSRNVFVAPGDTPRLIDFGRAEIYPRLFDFAALDIDLVLTLPGFKSGTEHDIDLASRWLVTATNTYPFIESTVAAKAIDTLPLLLRHLLHSRMTEELEGVTRAEYSNVLLFNLLRFIRFSSITVPAKIVAAGMISKLCQILGLSTRPQRRKKA